jgi:hypothetical protein
MVAQLAVATRGATAVLDALTHASRPCAGEALLSRERVDPSLRAKQPLAPEHIYKPRPGHSDISVLLKFCYRRSLSILRQGCIWRTSA